MPRVEVAERAGVGLDGAERPSEDVVVVRPNAVILLDGATTLRTDLPSGGWYAGQLANAIADRLDGNNSLVDVLADSIRSLAREHGLVAGNSPSSTVSLVRWTDDAVDALVLSDSPVIAFTATGPAVLADDRLRSVPRKSGYRARLRSGAGYGDDHLLVLRSSGAAMDEWRNTDGGFWVAEANPDAAYQAHTAHWQLSIVDRIIMATDGVSCGVDDYRIFPDWPAVLDLATERGVDAVLDEVRAAELEDPHGKRWPRAKPHDDQAMVLIDFGRDRSSADPRG